MGARDDESDPEVEQLERLRVRRVHGQLLERCTAAQGPSDGDGCCECSDRLEPGPERQIPGDEDFEVDHRWNRQQHHTAGNDPDGPASAHISVVRQAGHQHLERGYRAEVGGTPERDKEEQAEEVPGGHTLEDAR